MRRQALQRLFPAVVLASLSCLWLIGCTSQEPPPTPVPRVAEVSRSVDEAAIRQALHRYIEQNSPSAVREEMVKLDQISIESEYALVTWTHEGQGGQAVLHKQTGTWDVIDCRPGWIGFQGMDRKEVPVEVAKKLLDGIDPSWPSYEKF
jgi:hypothetical protein